MITFKGGPLDGVVNSDLEPDDELTAIWQHDKAVYLVEDEDGNTQGVIQSSQFLEPKMPVMTKPPEPFWKYSRFWSLVLAFIAVMLGTGTVFVTHAHSQALLYSVAFDVLLVAWVLK